MSKERLIGGVIYEFPDNTPDAVIDRFEANKTGQPAVPVTGGGAALPMPGRGVRPPTGGDIKGRRPEALLPGPINAALQGATMGFSDEAIAGIRAAMDPRSSRRTLSSLITNEPAPGSYESYVKAEREAIRKYAEEHPNVSTGLEMAGAVAPALATMGATGLPSALRAGYAAIRGAPAVAQAAPAAAKAVAPSLARMTGLGALQGGVTAVGTSEKPMGELPLEFGLGTVSGGATALGLGALGKYVAMPAFRTIKSALGFGNADKAADFAIARALQKDGMTPEMAAAKIASMQRGEMTLADLGENTAALLRKASAAPGEARMATKSALVTRETERIPRVSDDLRSLMSGSKDFYTDVQDLIRKRSSEAESLYQAAWDSGAKFGPKTAPDIERLRNLPSFKEAMKAGAKRMEDLGLDITDPKQTLRALHETKLALDDMIKSKVQSGASNEARTLISMRDRMLRDMENAAPEYRTARLAYAGDSEMLTAMEEGRDIYKMSEMDMRKLIDRFKDNPSEYDAFRAGIAQSMLEKLRVAGPTADPFKTVFGKDAEQKIRRAFRDDDAFDQFKVRLLEEQRMLQTEKQGFRRAAQDADLDTGAAGVGAAAQLAAGNPVAAAMEAARTAFPRVLGMPPEMAKSTTSKLLTPAPNIDPVMSGIMQSLKEQEAMLTRAATGTDIGAGVAGQTTARRPQLPQYPQDEAFEGAGTAPPSTPGAPPSAAAAP